MQSTLLGVIKRQHAPSQSSRVCRRGRPVQGSCFWILIVPLPWISHTTSLRLSRHICKMEMVSLPSVRLGKNGLKDINLIQCVALFNEFPSFLSERAVCKEQGQLSVTETVTLHSHTSLLRDLCLYHSRQGTWGLIYRADSFSASTEPKLCGGNGSQPAPASLTPTPPFLPLDWSLPGSSSIHGISQARILQRAAIPFSKASSQPRDQTPNSRIAGGFLTLNHQVSLSLLQAPVTGSSGTRAGISHHHHRPQDREESSRTSWQQKLYLHLNEKGGEGEGTPSS